MLGVLALAAGSVHVAPARAAASQSDTMGSPTVTTERCGGADQYAVSVAVSQRLFPHGGAPVVYLASGSNLADSLAAGPIAAKQGGAILYTATTSLPNAVGQELVRLAPARVEILGGTSAIGQAVVDRVTGLLAPATVIERIAGADADGTAAALSAATFAPRTASTVFIASDRSAAGAIAAGPAAALLGGPLLLAGPNSMPAATAAELDRLQPTRAVIVGDTAAVSDGVLLAVGRSVPTVERVSGADAYGTAIAVAKRFFPATTTDVMANGSVDADGLVAIPLAAQRAAPILPVPPDDMLPASVRDYLVAKRPSRIVISGTVSEVMRAQLIGFSDGRLAVQPATPAYPAYDSGYHDPGELLTLIRATEIAYPTLVHVFSIGKSYEGRDLWAAKISDNVSVEEGEPEVLVDTLHHADEHLGVEQALYLLRTLTVDYTTDPYVNRLVNSRVVWIVFAMNPDGWAYDLAGGKYHFWRKNRQPSGGYYGTDINRNYGYQWNCCGGSSSKPWAYNYHGTGPWSTPEARDLRDFVASRVVNGVQLIKTHVTLHVNGELILYPDGWSRSTAPPDIPADDHLAMVTMARAMARMNGYKAEASSQLYVTDGDEIDWLYHTYRIFSFTWELYPTDKPSLTAMVYPPYSIVAAQTSRNRAPLLYLIDAAGCPWATIGKAAQYCPGQAAPTLPLSTPSPGILLP
jgi:putative cell wall-binding protein